MAHNKNSQNTYNSTLEVASNLFLEKRFENITITEIADNLEGLTRGVVYHHFNNKEEISNSILNKMTNDRISIFDTLDSQSDLSGVEKVKQMLKHSLIINENPELYLATNDLQKNPMALTNK
ncbi:TetR/AcrR family transcriptional regulator [Bacillus pseudomycoides]|uniref:TetR/AcrR family transcriptional regulator n=1 Tax=Bacillus pseudomycoides TaxID=64104 RepID=UPI000BED82CC|nr:TetR/AcrR family transcriptional regulator [Bacillus pseudomycoides]PEE44004.1 TetR family transcriptional regulator [Bacillus pseudomycoides]PEI86631.1 TetR family transcriptional regulator [Bacillus pseudomycoides]PGA82232.1 TetR family transcriptional regulator [Bacillus pseudomycoides]PHF43968.1 TetR family transcriptional regulator [Bacillus pseudomycoides]